MKYLFVVEGTHDVAKFLEVEPNLDVVSVNGSAIDQNISYILMMSKTNQVVLCFDPDYAGLKIRSYFEQLIPNATHIHLTQDEARSKNNKKLGFEHLDPNTLKTYIVRATNNVGFDNNDEQASDIDILTLYELKLIGNNKSKELRNLVSSKLNLGYVNSKTFIKRLIKARITKKQLMEVTSGARNEEAVWTKLS